MGEAMKYRKRRSMTTMVRVTSLDDDELLSRTFEGTELRPPTRYIKRTYPDADFIVNRQGKYARSGAWGWGRFGDYVTTEHTDSVSVMTPEEFAQFYEPEGVKHG